MNVTSSTFAASLSLAKVLTPVDPSKTDETKTGEAKDASPTSAYGAAKEGSTPGQDVAKKLKDMSKALIALTLIQDPVERAKAAAKLYKDYSQVAKDYADASSGDRAAAQAQSDQNAAQNAAQAAGQPVDPNAPPPVAADGTPIPVDPQAQAAPQAQVVAPDAAAAQLAQPTTTPLMMSGAKPRFAADLYMEEIKTFAGAAKQMYEAAVQEAKFKKLAGKDDKAPGADDMEDAKKTLTEAAKAVEGPDATDEVQMPKGAGSVVSISA